MENVKFKIIALSSLAIQSSVKFTVIDKLYCIRSTLMFTTKLQVVFVLYVIHLNILQNVCRILRVWVYYIQFISHLYITIA